MRLEDNDNDEVSVGAHTGEEKEDEVEGAEEIQYEFQINPQ